MLAVAFTAIGIVWVQTNWGSIRHHSGRIPGWADSPHHFIGDRQIYRSTRSIIATALYVMTGVAALWSIFLLYRSRRPGRTWRFGRGRRPGAIASLVATGVLTCEIFHESFAPTPDFPQLNVWYQEDVGEVRSRYLYGPAWSVGVPYNPLCTMLGGKSAHAGLAVAGAWLALLLAKAWRSERTWVDRAGRGLGWFWILTALHFLLFPM
jgi:hypothetical protein